MKPVDTTFLFLLGATLVVVVYTFARIEKYLIAHRLVNPDTARPDLIDFYRKYKRHTKETAGRTDRLLWIHIGAGGAFILIGVVYGVLRLGSYILSLL